MRLIGVTLHGAVAQLGEHLLCKQGVTGSIPVSSTIFAAQQRQKEKANGVGFRSCVQSPRSRTSFAVSLFNNLE